MAISSFLAGSIGRPTQFVSVYSGCELADGYIGPIIVVSPAPICGLFLCFLYCFRDALIQPFMAICAIAVLNIGVLLRFSWLDVLHMNALGLRATLVFEVAFTLFPFSAFAAQFPASQWMSCLWQSSVAGTSLSA